MFLSVITIIYTAYRSLLKNLKDLYEDHLGLDEDSLVNLIENLNGFLNALVSSCKDLSGLYLKVCDPELGRIQGCQ